MLFRWTLIVPSVGSNLRALNPAEARLVISCSREPLARDLAAKQPDIIVTLNPTHDGDDPDRRDDR
jgi:hypothetical protein